MPEFAPVNLGNILTQAEGIKGARARNSLYGAQERRMNALAGQEQTRFDQQNTVFDQGQQDRIRQQLAQRFSAIASSSSPRQAASMYLGTPEFQESGRALGLPVEQFVIDDTDTDDSVRQQAMDAARMLGASNIATNRLENPNIPSNVRLAEWYAGLPEEGGNGQVTRSLYNEAIRSPTVRDVGGVPTDVSNPSAPRPLSTIDAEADATRRLAGAQTAGQSGGLELTPGQKAVDTKFADEYVQWQAVGGFADVNKNLEQLREVKQQLESGEVNLTGGLIGDQPRALLARTNPKALQAMELVEEVVQRNLRLILGAQFTEREGERLISRAYNPRLSEAENATRVGRLLQQIEDAAKAKQEAADYFSQHGTLSGWNGRLYSMSDFSEDGGSSRGPRRVRVDAQGNVIGN